MRLVFCPACGAETVEVEHVGVWCTAIDEHPTKRYVRMLPLPEGEHQPKEDNGAIRR